MTLDEFIDRFKVQYEEFFTVKSIAIDLIRDIDALGLYCYMSSMASKRELNEQENMEDFKLNEEKLIKMCDYFARLTNILSAEKEQFSYIYKINNNIYKSFKDLKDLKALRSLKAPKDLKDLKELKEKIIKKEKQEKILPDDILRVYHETLPDSPKIKVADKALLRQLKVMQINWPNYQKDGQKFSLESFRDYLLFIKNHFPWFVNPYVSPAGNHKQNNLRTITRETNISKIVNGEFSAS